MLKYLNLAFFFNRKLKRKSNSFDLVITVCDHAHETCPLFTGNVQKVHCGFEDPSGKSYEYYTLTLKEIEYRLIPLVKYIFLKDTVVDNVV